MILPIVKKTAGNQTIRIKIFSNRIATIWSRVKQF